MELDVRLATAKMYTAIEELGNRADSDIVLRPSSIGWCPARLWEAYHNPEDLKEERAASRAWAPLQGTWNEPLMALILRGAGAEVIDPPENDDDNVLQEPSPITGFIPHVDRLIRWPEVGLTEWCWLELKDLRAMAQIDLLLHTLQHDRQYWWQVVSYLKDAPTIMANFGRMSGVWKTLHVLGVVPDTMVFFSVAKDPSSTRMLLSQRLREPQYERDYREGNLGMYKSGPKKGQMKELTQEQHEMIANRVLWRERLEQNAEQSDFYMEVLPADDPIVEATWSSILETIELVKDEERAPVIHDPTLPEDQLHIECAVYCPLLEQCRTREQVKQFADSVELLQERSDEEIFAPFQD